MRLIILACTFLLAGTSFAITFDNDVPRDFRLALLSDLSFAYQIKSSSQTPLHKEIFDFKGGRGYKKFFESHITSVGLDSCGGGSSIGACVQPAVNPHKVWVTPNVTKKQLPQIARVLMLFHEARHSEEINA